MRALALALVACGGGSGNVKVMLTDAPLEGVVEVNVPVDHIELRMSGVEEDSGDEGGGGWTTLPGAPMVVDLLTLQGGATELIGEGDLPEGTISELRLVLGDGQDATLVFEDQQSAPLEIPSGDSSGLKLKGDIPVQADELTVVTIDFDAAASVNQSGNGDYKLTPVLSVVE
jgi:Domain of unknown function (DUF4382)